MKEPDFVSAMSRISGDASAEIAAAFESAPYGVYVDEPSHGCIYANPALLDLFGISWEDFSGYGWARHVFAEDAERVQAKIQEYEHTRETIDVTYRVRAEDNIRYVRARVSAIVNAEDRHVGSMGLIFDITEQQEFEKKVVENQKMAAIGQLSARLAHDLNNLLTAIMGSAELMALESTSENTAKHMNTLELAFDQARQLTGPLLTLTRQRMLTRAAIAIDPELKSLQRLISGTVGEGIHVTSDFAAPDAHVPLDPTQLGQVLLNLATNAADAMSGTGALHIATRKEGEQVILTVADEGTGMSTQTSDRAFEAFFTTKEEGRGSGLGLATVRHIVEYAGGHIKLLPREPMGIIASVSLPVVEPDLYGGIVSTERSGKSNTFDAEGAVVLLVEDQEAIRQSLGYSLALANFDVRAAAHLAEGRMRLEESTGLDLLIVDIMLPDGNGTQLAHTARDKYPHLQIIFTSGFAGKAAAEIDLSDTNTAFLAKPFRATDIMQTIQHLRQQRP